MHHGHDRLLVLVGRTGVQRVLRIRRVGIPVGPGKINTGDPGNIQATVQIFNKGVLLLLVHPNINSAALFAVMLLADELIPLLVPFLV